MVHRLAQMFRTQGKIDSRLMAIVAGVVILAILIVGAFIWLSDETPEAEPVPMPVPETGPALETVEPADSEQERGDTARTIIDSLRQASAGPDYAEALARAREFQADERLADAQLLYFFAARGGHAPAAFELASLYDPNHHPGDDSLLQDPDPFQAYKWYQQALEAGHEQAAQRLEELRAWTEQASEAGNAEARRLLLQWE